jgi:hypothetical protein
VMRGGVTMLDSANAISTAVSGSVDVDQNRLGSGVIFEQCMHKLQDFRN